METATNIKQMITMVKKKINNTKQLMRVIVITLSTTTDATLSKGMVKLDLIF